LSIGKRCSWKNSVESLKKKIESLRILWSSARWALSRCKECTEEELYCEFRRNRISEDFESSAKWASSGCIGAQKKNTELLNIL
jgi:hypothetical protein